MCYDKMKNEKGVAALPGNILFNLLYALICGFTEFLGVGATTHCRMFELLSGKQQTDLIMPVALRAGLIVALLVSNWSRLRRLMRERSYSRRSRRLKRPPDPIAQLDLKFLRMAILPIIAGVFLYTKTAGFTYGFLAMTLVLLLNAAILLVPRMINSGNKDGRSVSRLDGILLGLGGVAGFVPGLSRMGCMLTGGAVAGLDRGYCLDMALILSIPALLGMIVLDVMALLAAKVALSLTMVALGLLYACLAFVGGWLSVVTMRFLSIKIGFTGFAYYSFGLALFTFVFYLVI